MNILTIAYYTILRCLRDRKSMSLMILMPIILILILGTALKSTYKPENMSSLTVYYMNNDRGEIGKSFDEYLKMDEIRELLEVKPAESLEEAEAYVNDGRASALIVIEEDFSDKVVSGQKGNIRVYTSKYSSFKASIVETIVDCFVADANTMEAVKRLGAGMEYSRYGSIEDLPVSTSGKMPGAMDYYAVTMLVMILMYGANYGCFGMAEDYKEEMGARIRCTPVKLHEQFLGKTLGIVFTVFWQGIVLLLFTKYVYGANWGKDLLTVIFVCFSLSVLATAFGVMACMIFKKRTTASGFLSVVIPLFTLVAGGFVKFQRTGPAISAIRQISPNYQAQTAIFNIIYEGPLNNIWIPTAVLWTASLAMFGMAVAAGRRYVK